MDNLPTDASRPLKRNSNDVGWEYGVLCDPRNADKVKCKLCGKQFSAIKGCENKDGDFDPGNWWSTYGCGAPTLQKLATRILALTSSSSGCERNWSSFEGIRENNADVIFDDGNEDTVEEWLVGRVQDIDSDLGLLLSTQAPRVRDLYDDDFESEEEEEYVVDMEFEPDVYQDIPTFRESQQQPI
ncbi:hypothetical protein YC2023_044209 [Brassica napus]